MSPAHTLFVLGAGFLAGIINTVAGAGSLLTFPALLAAGLAPLPANVSNCIGIIPGSISGAYGLRAELRGQRRQLILLSTWIGVGSSVGAVLLLMAPSRAFSSVVPVLVGLAGLLVLLQPLVVRVARAGTTTAPRASGPVVGAIGIYSGYFGAAQGVLLIGALGMLTSQPLRRINASKNVLAVTGNGVAGLIYVFFATVNWTATLLLSAGSVAGGPIGAALARRLPTTQLRIAVAMLALAVAVVLAVRTW